MRTAIHVVTYLAAPLDSAPPVRCTAEMTGLAEALRRSGQNVSLSALRPPSPELLAELREKHVLHVSSHAGGGNLQLQDAAGRSVEYRGADFASAVGLGWSLIVLNGCDSVEPGEVINAQTGSTVVSSVDYVPDEAAQKFTEIFYARALQGQNLEDVLKVTNRLLQTRWPGVQYWLLPGECSALETSSGSLEVQSDFNAATRAAAGAEVTVPSRRMQLLTIYEGLESEARGICISGPPGAGVSAVLRAATHYYGWLGPAGVQVLDGRHATVEDIKNARTMLADPRAMVVCDHFDELRPESAAELHTSMEAPRHTMARIILGSSIPPRGVRVPVVALREWEHTEARDWLRDGLGDSFIAWAWVLDRLPLYPGRLQSVLTYILSGAGPAEVGALISEGDPKSGALRIVEAAWSDPAARTCLAIASAYGYMPRHLLWEAWRQATHRSELDPPKVQELFADVVTELSRRRLLRVQLGVRPDGTTLSYVEVEPDVRAAAKAKRNGMTPAQRSVAATVVLEALEAHDSLHAQDLEQDSHWIACALHEAMRQPELAERALNAVYPLFDRGASARMLASVTTLSPMLEHTLALARLVGDWDKVVQLTLVEGELHYRRARLAAAEASFRRVFRYSPSASRKVQAYRALGQVSYRRGKYDAAIASYQKAHKHFSDADPFVVTTVMQEEGKALSRKGRHLEAIAALRDVVARRQQQDGLRELAKAQHELARALLRIREFPEARKLFVLAREAGMSTGAVKWALGPLYHLFLIELETPDMERAGVLLAELDASAKELGETLWMTFSMLGRGMLSFDQGRYEASHKFVQHALSTARDHGYAQVAEDARWWVRERSTRAIALMGGEAAVAGAADVLALVEGLPVGKARKGLRYFSRPDLVTALRVEMESQHGTRTLAWSNRGGWACTCLAFADLGNCSHVVSVNLRGIAPLTY